MVPQSTAQAKYQKFAHEQFRGLYLEGDRRPYHSQFSHCSGPVLIKSNNGAGRALERCPGRVAGLCWEGHSQDRRRARARRTSVRVHPSLYLSTRFLASLSYAHTHTSPPPQTSPTSRRYIFGYGSLIWRPGDLLEDLDSWEVDCISHTRLFGQRSHDHRGDPSFPGLVCTLLENERNETTDAVSSSASSTSTSSNSGVCSGRMWLVPPEQALTVLETLDYREKGGYSRRCVCVCVCVCVCPSLPPSLPPSPSLPLSRPLPLSMQYHHRAPYGPEKHAVPLPR